MRLLWAQSNACLTQVWTDRLIWQGWGCHGIAAQGPDCLGMAAHGSGLPGNGSAWPVLPGEEGMTACMAVRIKLVAG